MHLVSLYPKKKFKYIFFKKSDVDFCTSKTHMVVFFSVELNGNLNSKWSVDLYPAGFFSKEGKTDN